MHPQSYRVQRLMAAEAEGAGATTATPPAAEAAPPPAPATPPAAETPPPAAAAETPPPPVAEPKKDDWRDARIRELTAKLNEAKKAAPAATTGPSLTQAEIDAQVQAKALELANLNEFNRQCNEVADKGKAEFKDFGDKVAACQTVMNPQDPVEVQQYNEVLATAIRTGQAHRLIYDLGQNPGEMKRLMGMNPVDRALEMASKAAKLGASPPVPEPSNVPKPITPIGSSGVHYDGIQPDDASNGTKLPVPEWMARREKQAQERGLQ